MDANQVLLDRLLGIDKIQDFIKELSCSDCKRCSLSKHDNRIVVYRGNPLAQIMLIGEAPGLEEDKLGKAFVGPAGQLADKIFEAIGLDPEVDMYWSNICKCRPVANPGSGKQNYTPIAEQHHNCIPYIRHEIKLINPKVIILTGLTAARSILGNKTVPSMGACAGKFLSSEDSVLKDREIFLMYHPASILHAKKGGEKAYQDAKHTTWDHVRKLRLRLDELQLGA